MNASTAGAGRGLHDLASVAVALETSHTPLTAAGLPEPRALVCWLAGMSEIEAVEAWAAACSLWASEARIGAMSPLTAEKYRQEARYFIDHARQDGNDTLDAAVDSAEDWIYSAVLDRSTKVAVDPSVGTLHLRRSAVRALYVTARSLGLTSARPVVDLVLPPRDPGRRTREAADDELRLIHETADTMRGSRGPVTVALGDCGSATGEMGVVKIGAVNLPEQAADLAEGWVDLPGTRTIATRRVRIPSEWAYTVFKEWLTIRKCQGAGLDHVLLPAERAKGDLGSTMSASLGAVLTRARVADRGQITPSSLRAAAGRRVFDATNDITAAARFLGLSKLDQTADLIGWTWAEDGPTVEELSLEHGPGLTS